MTLCHVVGMGAVTCHGLGVEALWRAVAAGDSRILPVTRFSTEGLCSAIAAQAPNDEVLREAARPLAQAPSPPDRASRLLLGAAAELFPILQRSPVSPERRGVIVGTTKGAFECASMVDSMVDSMLDSMLDPLGACARALASAVNAQGPVVSVSAACASSLSALGEAMLWLETGACDEVVVGGADALHEFVYLGFHALKALSPSPARPFDAHRRGLSLGEGAGVVCLRRGDGPAGFGVLEGFGAATDAFDQTAPDPQGTGLQTAITQALRRAQVQPRQLQRYHAHGTATAQNDAMEARVLTQLFGPEGISVSATKGSYGHTLGAAGILDVIVALRGLAAGSIPPTVGCTEVDPLFQLDVSPTLRTADHARVLLASAGFGGLNAALVARRAENP